MPEQPPIPPAYKILLDHGIDQFLSSILGTTVGTLIDKGLTDEEIQTVITGFVRMIRDAVKNPRTAALIHEQIGVLKDSAERTAR